MIETDTFLLLGTVAVSLAGFASLLYSMQTEEPSRLFTWRVRYIVSGALSMRSRRLLLSGSHNSPMTKS